MTQEELFEIRESDTNQLANLQNWIRVLDNALPDDMVFGRRTKITKRDMMLAISRSFNKLRENNVKLQRLIDETYGSDSGFV